MKGEKILCYYHIFSMNERRVEKTILNNGVVVLSETMEHLRSVSLSIWIRAGSRHEQAEQNGLTHFIEHALFKGTRRRNARQIAVEADVIGGTLDAFTTREFTGYYIKSLDRHVERSFDLLADLVTEPLFDATEMEKERDVILEEIKMVDDTPDDLVHELFTSSFWPDHPLGRPIEGTANTVASFSADTLRGYFRQIYHPKNIVVAAVGNISHARLVELAGRHLGGLKSDLDVPTESAPRTNIELIVSKKSGLEQTHIVLGAACPNILSEERYAVTVFNTILGGGLSSRLFQSVREEHGMAYSVYSAVSAFRDVGCLSIYMAVSQRRALKAIEVALKEVRVMKEQYVPAVELQAVKDQIKTSMLLNLDSSSSRMNNLAQNEIIFGRDFSVEELLAAIDAVTVEDIRRLAREIFQPERLTATVLAASDRLKLDRSHLSC